MEKTNQFEVNFGEFFPINPVPLDCGRFACAKTRYFAVFRLKRGRVSAYRQALGLQRDSGYDLPRMNKDFFEMRTILAFAFLMLYFSLAWAEGPTAAELQQELRRACPRGYSVVNGKCTPPCEQGTRRNLAGRCVAQSCPAGQEMVRDQCMPVCADGKKREGTACVNICGTAEFWRNGKCIATGDPNAAQCGPYQTAVGDHCVSTGNPPPEQAECGYSQTNVGGNCVNTGNCPEGQERVGNECKHKCLPKQERDADGICVIKCPEGQVRRGNFCQKPGQGGLGSGFNR